MSFPGEVTVLTRRGAVQIGDVFRDDEVFTHRRRWRRVTAVHNQGIHKLVSVTGSGHTGVLRTTGHQEFLCGRENYSSWIKANALAGWRWSSPLVGPVKEYKSLADMDDIDPPYRFGLVMRVEDAGERAEVWEITVEEDHSFLADGLVVGDR